MNPTDWINRRTAGASRRSRERRMRAFADALRGIRWGWVPPFFAIAFANMGLSSVRWLLFLRADGVEVPVRKLFASHWIASFCNFFLPSNVGGDLYRIADVGRKSGSAVRGTASVFMDRLSGFLAMSLLGFVFPLAGLRFVPREHWPWLLVPVAFFLAFAGIFALVVFGQGLLRATLHLLPGRATLLTAHLNGGVGCDLGLGEEI